MRSFRAWSILFLVPVLAALLTLGGCSKKDKDKKTDDKDTDAKTAETGKASDDDKKTGDTEKKDDKGSAGTSETPYVEGKGKATLTGTINFDGDVPERKDIVDPKNKDHAFCHMGDALDQTWIVDKEKKTLANVVVFLVPPAGQHFKVMGGDKWWPETVKVDQPHCAFEPHVSVAFPYYFDADKGKEEKTGQKVEILNSAPIGHNTRYKGSPKKNPGASTNLQPAKDKEHPTELPLDLKPDTKPVQLNCDIHTWMVGYIVVLDHPYADVTKKDGTYKIENIPAGVPLKVMYWHESFKAPKEVGTVTFKEGENTLDHKVSK